MKVKGKCLSTMEELEYNLNYKGLDTYKLTNKQQCFIVCRSLFIQILSQFAFGCDQSFWSVPSLFANVVLRLPAGQISTCG